MSLTQIVNLTDSIDSVKALFRGEVDHRVIVRKLLTSESYGTASL
jgi:hypothetical protein